MSLADDIEDEVNDAIVASLNSYAASLEGKGIMGILNSSYQPPSVDLGGGLNLNDPNTRSAVQAWQDTMSKWQEKYGSLNGYNEFKAYWSLTSNDGISAFTSARYAAVRDKFGYARDDILKSHRPTQIPNLPSTNGSR